MKKSRTKRKLDYRREKLEKPLNRIGDRALLTSSLAIDRRVVLCTCSKSRSSISERESKIRKGRKMLKNMEHTSINWGERSR